MRQYSLYVLLIVTAFACGKDKLETKPSIKIKSVNGNFIPSGGTLSITMEFADKEGDISNSLFVQKIRTNARQVPTVRDSFSLPVPEFPSKTRGDLVVNMDYTNYLVSAINPPTTGNPPRFEDDTLVIRFVLRDLAGNTSDTLNAGTFIVSRN